jgi:Flp pilus assembly CpaE family ATPase
VGALRAVATLGDLLRAQGVAEEQLRLVVTRQERSRPFSAEDLAKLVGLPITATIPEDPVLPKSLRSGEGTAGRRGPGVEAVRELAEMLTAAVTTCPLPRAAAA